MAWLSTDLHPYLMLFAIGFLPSEIWRLLSVVIARGLDEDSPFVVWVRTVATTLLAGVVAKIIFTPPGALAFIPLWGRLGAMCAGVLSFYGFKRNVFAAIFIGEFLLMMVGWFYQP
jgi:Branched-chain amino acid transport protein (AzlD)